MTIKYAYCDGKTREYLYANTREELINCLANEAVEAYISHYCNGELYTIVEIDESSGLEKWYTPTGEQRLTSEEIKAQLRYLQSFKDSGEIPVSML